MWKLAWRNLWRNRTRTLILLTAIGLSYALMIVGFGVVGDLLVKMEDRSAKAAGGSILIHGEGYWNAQSNDIAIDRPDEVVAAVEGVEAVEAVVPRVLLNGMLSSPRGKAGVQLAGIDRQKQAKVRDMAEHLVEGDFLSGEHEHPLVLGAGLVETLDVELGDKVVLTASDVDGEVTRALFRLRGVVKTGSEHMDRAVAYTTLEAAQEAVGMGRRVHQLGLLLEHGVETGPVAEEIRERLGAVRAAEAGENGLEVLTWQEAMPQMVAYLTLEENGMYVYMVLIFAIVAFVIANTFLMSVKERVREFGLFSALGLDDRRIGRLVFAETLLLALVAICCGFALGFAGHLLIDFYGINIAEIFGGEMELSGVSMADMTLRSEVTPVRWLVATGGVLVLIFLSAAYPAWKATKLAPTKAMEFYEH